MIAKIKRFLQLPVVIPFQAFAAIFTDSFTNHTPNPPFWPTIWAWVQTGKWAGA